MALKDELRKDPSESVAKKSLRNSPGHPQKQDTGLPYWIMVNPDESWCPVSIFHFPNLYNTAHSIVIISRYDRKCQFSACIKIYITLK